MELAKAIKKAKRVYLCGNGGSAANAIHLANDLISVGIKAHALTADVATLTAIANDYSYTEIFSRQLEVFGEPGDLLIALSGSGKSLNILDAMRTAVEKGMTVVMVKGAYGDVRAAPGIFPQIIEDGIDMQEAENAQLKIGHQAMRWIKENA